jgi:hypothetical protein
VQPLLRARQPPDLLGERAVRMAALALDRADLLVDLVD